MNEEKVEMGKILNMLMTQEINLTHHHLENWFEFFSYVRKFIKIVIDKLKQKPSTRKIKRENLYSKRNYKGSTKNPAKNEQQQKIKKASSGS